MTASPQPNDGGWSRMLAQLAPWEEPPSLAHGLVMMTVGGESRLQWAAPTEPGEARTESLLAASAAAKAHVTAVVNDTIRALPGAGEDAPDILFPEQHDDIFRSATAPLDARELRALSTRIESRLARYATPPSVELQLPLALENPSALMPFLHEVAPGSYLSIEDIEGGAIRLTSRLDHTPGDDEVRAQQLLTQLFDDGCTELEAVGTFPPQGQKDELKEEFESAALTAASTIALLESIPIIAQDRRLSTRNDGADALARQPTPTEAIASLIDEMDSRARQYPDASPGRQFCHALGQTVRRYWLTDRLDTASTIQFLSALRQSLQQMPQQPPLAVHMAAEIGTRITGLETHGTAGPHATRLHDNVNGRKWESAFAEAMAEHPSPGMLRAATDLRRLLSQVLARCTHDQQEAIMDSTVNLIRSAYPASWFTADEDNAELLDGGADAAVLRRFLNQPATDGASCMGTYLVACRVLTAMQEDAPEIATWKDASDDNYALLQDERGDEKFPKDDFQSGPDAGIQMRHQISPRFADYDEENVRGVLSSVTDFDARTPEMDTALATGRPTVWGSSGTTNLLLHFLADASRDPQTANAVASLDIDHAILGLATMVMRDGGHSLREVLHVLEQTADKLPDPVRRQPPPGPAPASNYGAFFSRFNTNAATRQLLGRANDEAWRSTLDYRRGLRS